MHRQPNIKHVTGAWGEDIAVVWLQKQGFRIICRNWRKGSYELDIVCVQQDELVFVEVKTRSSDWWGNPEEAVSKGKIKRIVAAADFYLNEYNIDLSARFDIIAVIWTGKSFEIEHIDDAFLAPLN